LSGVTEDGTAGTGLTRPVGAETTAPDPENTGRQHFQILNCTSFFPKVNVKILALILLVSGAGITTV
jgi:hypothetical protein